jgi:hypothetical protein
MSFSRARASSVRVLAGAGLVEMSRPTKRRLVTRLDL